MRSYSQPEACESWRAEEEGPGEGERRYLPAELECGGRGGGGKDVNRRVVIDGE